MPALTYRKCKCAALRTKKYGRLWNALFAYTIAQTFYDVAMNTESSQDTAPLNGPIFATFIKYLIPSLFGLIAMTSASLVDGIFIGNYVGTTALAAVNLIIPIITVIFGVGLMLAIGGSVRSGKYLGEYNKSAASSIFSKTLVFATLYTLVVIVLALGFEQQLFAGLGATTELFPVMSEYYRVILPFLLPQIITVVLYFFVRMDGAPNLAAGALAAGSTSNIILDYVFIVELSWGLSGAAWATGLSQLISCIVLLFYFVIPGRKLIFSVSQTDWREVLQAAYNGISEFINEISGAIVAFIINWMLIQRAGVEGVAAVTVVNYLLMLGFMAFFSIADTIQVMVSQNFGAQNSQRIRAFLKTALLCITVVSLSFIGLLLLTGESLIFLFVDDDTAGETVALANDFIGYIWPMFLFVGINMLISGYLTAIHLPFQSGVVALCRSLILPAILLVTFYRVMDDYRFIVALPVAEALSFALALFIFSRHSPSKSLSSQ